MKIYLASPFFTHEQLSAVRALETAMDLAEIDYYSPRSEGVLIDMTQKEKVQRKAAIYKLNIDNIKECDKMVAIIDDRDTGTIWEMGYATALGKDIITLSVKDYGLNVMIAESVRAHTLSIDDAIKCIKDENNKGTLIKDVF